jgi:hypothetical protein
MFVFSAAVMQWSTVTIPVSYITLGPENSYCYSRACWGHLERTADRRVSQTKLFVAEMVRYKLCELTEHYRHTVIHENIVNHSFVHDVNVLWCRKIQLSLWLITMPRKITGVEVQLHVTSRNARRLSSLLCFRWKNPFCLLREAGYAVETRKNPFPCSEFNQIPRSSRQYGSPCTVWAICCYSQCEVRQ